MINIGSHCFFLLLMMRMETSVCSYLVSCLMLSSFLFDNIDACWGRTAPDDAAMTPDYPLSVGSDLVLNCTLITNSSRKLNSSHLVIEKGDRKFARNLSEFTRVIDDRTIQLKLPNATSDETGLYICMIKGNRTVLCGSKVSVGYPPQNVTKFSCKSRNFDDLNCTWSMEKNDVLTKYTIVKSLYLPGLQQKCPNSTEKADSCVWSSKTDPPFGLFSQNISFTVTGNNTLGKNVENFTVDVYSNVIPNSPENLEVSDIGQQTATIRWEPPTMRNFAGDFPLKYELWISKAFYNSSDKALLFDAENSTIYLLDSLIPHIIYNISLRCRSMYTERDDMWSDFISRTFKTLPDVPYKSPEVIPEAFEIHTFEESRSVSLYWKVVPKLYHNGEEFYYHVKYHRNGQPNTSAEYTLNTSFPFIVIKNLQKNSPYTFQIHSANENGISKDFGSIFVDPGDKIVSPPKEVIVISQGTGHYNVTWIPPNNRDNFNYIVFWCSSMKPWQSRCDSSIQWTKERLSGTNIVLNLSDIKTNFQFAVVSELNGSISGMQWALCILPHKGGLSKIKYLFVEQKNSTTLKVIWNLDCPTEKSVMQRYEITYCGVDKHKNCNMIKVENGNADNFLLTNLYPFTNYSVKIRAINEHNKTSEDSDEVYQSTMPGAPSGSPQNIHVSSVGKNSFFISWTPPLEPNGVITQYVVSYNGYKRTVDASSFNESQYNVKIGGLKPFHVYAVQIQACVNHDCSIKSHPITIQTDIDEPGYMVPPSIIEINSTHFNISWREPAEPNGRIDFYEIMWRPEKRNFSIVPDNIREVSGTTAVVLDVKCPSLGSEGIKYLFYVRAVNKKNDTNLYGKFSESTQVKACFMPEDVGMFVGTIIGITFGVIIVLIVLYRMAMWIRLEIADVKDIEIRMHKDLGPETNSLSENLKEKQNGNAEAINDKKSFVDENKNRHGSGSSQFSNSSAEELTFRIGKCKFERKPSGDSSGCSSMSSSTTPRFNLSSDSGTESDIVVIPPSPDSGVTEPNLYNGHKTPLFVVEEVNEHEKSMQNTVSPEKQHLGHKNAVNDVILKYPPYSNFDQAGNTSSPVPWRGNPLAFYKCNLANSEPSVFGTEKQVEDKTVFAPYSKVGLAKSSGDLNQNGYSKFGYPPSQKRFSIPPSNVNFIAMVMTEDTTKKEWPTVKKILDEKCSQHKDKSATLSNNLTEDTGYIKVGQNKMCANTPSKPYVPFNEIKNQMDQSRSLMTDNTDPKLTFNSSLIDNEKIYFAGDAKWSPFNYNNKKSSNNEAREVLLNAPFSQNTDADCIPSNKTFFTANNYGCSPLAYKNSDDLLRNVIPHSDIKLDPHSPTNSLGGFSFDNSATVQHQTGSLPTNILNPTGSSIFGESHLRENTTKKSDCCDIPNEVIVTPVTLKNGYVPLHSLSDSMCDETLTHLPNTSNSTNLRNCEPYSICSSTHNGDMELLAQNPVSETVSVVTSKRDSLKDTSNCFQNGNGYASLSLKYILKPIPKMESEICEV